MVRKASAARVVAGMLLTVKTGSRQSETHVACAKKAPKNFGGEPRTLSKRLSLPSSVVIREKRKLPSRVAQTVTAALRTTCLQFQALTAPLLVRLAKRLGHAGAEEPIFAVALARRVGRKSESVVQEM